MLTADLCDLWAEGVSVVYLRSQKLAGGGPKAVAEAQLMVAEKIDAQQELLGRFASGKLGKTPLAVMAGTTRYMLEGVRANRRRLSR